jgi:hypothetical protein
VSAVPPTLPPERCQEIARMVLGTAATEAQVTELAADIGAFAADFPPPTQEQLDQLAVLLRPDRSNSGRPDAA